MIDGRFKGIGEWWAQQKRHLLGVELEGLGGRSDVCGVQKRKLADSPDEEDAELGGKSEKADAAS